ncbi:MAG TPA: hypothetical protein VIL85_26160 [Thermomicrobiales bacterium]
MSVGVDTLLAIYLVLLGVGLIGTIALTIWAQRIDDSWPIPLGATLVVAGVTCFGGAGVLALRLFEFGSGWSVLAAGLFAALSVVLFGLLARIARHASERRVAFDELVGGVGAVVVTIEPGRTGAVAMRRSPPLVTVAAKSSHAAPLPVGTTVIVTALHTGFGSESVEVTPLPHEHGFTDATQ